MENKVRMPQSIQKMFMTSEVTIYAKYSSHLTCWCLSCLCLEKVLKDLWEPSRWLERERLQRQPQWRLNVSSVPRCGPPGSAGWQEPARLTEGRLVPAAAAAACGSAAGGAGL